ncbi:uncharacterized protein BJ212DRAFT_1592678 [Suillus subaureus]|uniref:CHAT domain-containing protein n=1 Tax=Suillus subaureus TaxID=48587 RepID=A0A9P7APR8_9AGAM|nr:uncharacterized protein BJ212DRAFT_1592678 [Suillus subaureus]KAG1793790.1 hypothetical protein BJ212DRAFT_1592678 [Suillus subaureus]
MALHRETLALHPDGHPDQTKTLNNLANQYSIHLNLSTWSWQQGNDQDLDEAITLHREVLVLHPAGHSDWPKSLNCLAGRLSSCFNDRGNGRDLDEAITLHREALALSLVHESLATVYLLFYQSGIDGPGSLNAVMDHLKAAANVVSRGFLSRLRASLHWVHHASQHSHGTELEAYATSMQLLDVYMSVTVSVSSRHNAIKEFPSTLAVDAVSCALRSGDDPKGQCRSSSNSVQTSSGGLEWSCEEVPKIEGFSRFLLPPLFSDLQEAARDGPIIVLVACKSSCNAIIIPHKQPPISIQLPTDFEKLARLVDALQEAVHKEAGPKGKQPALTKALRELWGNVVRPVVEKLGEFAPRGSRIWCPTSLFNFLPLHAAGEYRANGGSLSQ